MFTYSAFADEIASDLSIQITELKKHGMNHIEARGINGKNISSYTVAEIKEVKKILDDNNFKISALGSPIGKIQITDDFVPELEKFKNTLELAKALDTKYLRMFSFFMDTSKAEEYRDEVMERLSKYVEEAKGSGIMLLHENEKDIYGDTAERCLDIFKTLNSDILRATFDPANFVQCKEDTIKAYGLLKPYIEYMHIKDAKWENGEVVPAGMGDGNVAQILSLLKADNFSGFLSLEPHLGNFEGFADLEGGVTVKKEASGPDKFDIAYKALDKIVKGLN